MKSETISKMPVINLINFLYSFSLLTNSAISEQSCACSKEYLNTSFNYSFGIFSKLCYMKLNIKVTKETFSNILSAPLNLIYFSLANAYTTFNPF